MSMSEDTNDDCLVIDEPTARDLEIFTCQAGGLSLFEFCNLTRSSGGAAVLRRRMQRPSSAPAPILETQASLRFITEHREAFRKMTSGYIAGKVALYTCEVLPVIPEENSLLFFLGVASVRGNHATHFSHLVLGVQITCTFIRRLREFVALEELAEISNIGGGEVGELYRELSGILEHPKLQTVPDYETSEWAWKILRLDQVFRMYCRSELNRLLALIYEIDALVAMADVTKKHQFVFPEVLEGELNVQADALRHPMLEAPVGNPVALSEAKRVLFLTGPNMAGKTTYLRSFATALYFAHLGMGVPARKFSFVPVQRLFSSISLSDDLIHGISYFRAEALRVKAIATAMAEGHRVIAVMDEPFKGTNVKDALDASAAVLERFGVKSGCLFMLSSHLIELSDGLKNSDQVDCRHFAAGEGDGALTFDYRLRPGVSNQRLGMRVLEEEGVFSLLEQALEADKSR